MVEDEYSRRPLFYIIHPHADLDQDRRSASAGYKFTLPLFQYPLTGYSEGVRLKTVA